MKSYKKNKLDEITIEVTFFDKKKIRWIIEVQKSYRNGYMELTMSGKSDRSFGQNLDKIVPENKYQKDLKTVWKKYHLSEINITIWKDIKKTIEMIEREEEKRREDESELSWSDIDDDKIIALAQHLEMTAEEAMDSIMGSRLGDSFYDSDGTDYLVCTDSEADDEADDATKQLIDDIGITAVNGWENFIDEDRLGNDLAYDVDEYDYGYENPENIFVDEESEGEDVCDVCDGRGDIDLDDGGIEICDECDGTGKIKIDEWTDEQRERAGDLANEMKKEEITDDPLSYIENNYGSFEEFSNFENYVDMNELVEYIIETDGRGSVLNTYNGEEYKEKVDGEYYYIYNA